MIEIISDKNIGQMEETVQRLNKKIEIAKSKQHADENVVLRFLFWPTGIYHNRKTDETIVTWMDGSKVTVKPMEGEKSSPYTAFTAALAKKIFGSNSQVNKIVAMTQEPEKKKPKAIKTFLTEEVFQKALES